MKAKEVEELKRAVEEEADGEWFELGSSFGVLLHFAHGVRSVSNKMSFGVSGARADDDSFMICGGSECAAFGVSDTRADDDSSIICGSPKCAA